MKNSRIKQIIHKYGKCLLQDNNGAGIVTAIVVSAFITIIATTLLYITGKNYIAKQTDYQNKISFYQAEEVLDKFKAYLTEDVDTAFACAYADTMANYVDHAGSANVDSYYAEAYTDRLYKLWTDRRDAQSYVEGDTDSQLTKAVRQFLIDKLQADGVDAETAANMAACIRSVDDIQVPPAKDKFILVGVRAAYEPEDGYSTYVYTDIGLELPNLYIAGMTNTADAGTELDITECVKYMNWRRYDD